MALHVFVFVFLLVVYLFLLLAKLGPSSSGRAKRSTLHRLLKPRTPDDCLACRLSSTNSSGGGSATAPVRRLPRGQKSAGSAPLGSRLKASPVPTRSASTLATPMIRFTRLFGDGKHGRAEPIQTFRCQACRTTFTSRRNTPLYRLKTPSHQVAMVLAALAEGLDPSATSRVFGYRQATITTWLTRVGKHAQTLHERFFCHLHLPHLQLDELRTRLRSHTRVLWLWLVIDPTTKLLPVLHLGPRTQDAAHSVIHSLRHILAPGCHPLFTSDGLNLYFYAALGPFWILVPGVWSGQERARVSRWRRV